MVPMLIWVNVVPVIRHYNKILNDIHMEELVLY